MVEIQSKEVIDKVSDELKVQPSIQIPRELAKLIQLVYDVSPVRLVKVANLDVSDGTAGTLITTSSEKDTFLLGATISVSKDVVNNGIFSAVDCVPFGDTRRQVLIINYEPVTAASNLGQTITFKHPIKLDRNTSVRILNGAALASIDTAASITFYETDPQ